VHKGAWCMVHGAWCMVHGAWCMVHGARCMVHKGAWCMVPLLRHPSPIPLPFLDTPAQLSCEGRRGLPRAGSGGRAVTGAVCVCSCGRRRCVCVCSCACTCDSRECVGMRARACAHAGFDGRVCGHGPNRGGDDGDPEAARGEATHAAHSTHTRARWGGSPQCVRMHAQCALHTPPCFGKCAFGGFCCRALISQRPAVGLATLWRC